jgi:hypothetical protein
VSTAVVLAIYGVLVVVAAWLGWHLEGRCEQKRQDK